MGRLHPLRMEYVRYIRENYGIHTGGDKNPNRTELIAQKVLALGISYGEFVEIACLLWQEWSEEKGWNYPYWNLVTSGVTFDMLTRLRAVEEEMVVDNPGHAEAFDAELGYAVDYLHWFSGGGKKPRRVFDKDPKLVQEAAEYLCNMYGIECESSNYNDIATKIGVMFFEH